MRGAVFVAVAAAIGNMLQGWDNSVIAGIYVTWFMLISIVFELFCSDPDTNIIILSA